MRWSVIALGRASVWHTLEPMGTSESVYTGRTLTPMAIRVRVHSPYTAEIHLLAETPSRVHGAFSGDGWKPR
jgi:hypothetical protein